MKRFLLTLATGLAAFGTPALALPVAPRPHEPKAGAAKRLPVKVERDVHYATIGGQKLYLDVAAPKGGGPYPCVVMFHGGAWVMGSRKDLSAGSGSAPSLVELVAARGYVAVSVGYRLAPKAKFPAQIQDARAAVRFLRAHAKDYNVDPDRFAAGGFSAGGHIALLLGLAGKVDGWDAGGHLDQSAGVQCVVDFFGPTDLSLYSKSPGLQDSYMVPVLGKECKTDPCVYERASPITYASKDDPPVLMVHGTFDLLVPIVHSERLLKKLKGAGADAELVTVRGEGHGWGGETLTRTLDDAVEFLDKHLKGKK